MNISIEFDQDGKDLLTTVYPDTIGMPTLKEMVDGHLDYYLRVFEKAVKLRQYCAITGAMRWPNSQEATIHLRLPYI